LGSGAIDSVEMFDIETWKWKEMKKLPVPTANTAAIVVHDGILLLGNTIISLSIISPIDVLFGN
jgi:hypothetical protein